MSEEMIVDPHPDDVLSMAIKQRDAARAERDKLQRACITLGWVIDGMAQSLRAAWIDIRQGDLKGAAQWVLNSVPDVDDNDPEDQWNGTETSQEWFDRTPIEPLAQRTADGGTAVMLADEIAAKQPQPAPELAAAMAETRIVRAENDKLRQRIAAYAAELNAEADVTSPSKTSETKRAVAARLREIGGTT